MSTYQLGAEGQWGVAYKITPETTEVEQNVMKCFQVNGTVNETVTPQASLPDVQGLQVCVCNKYSSVVFEHQNYRDGLCALLSNCWFSL